MSDMSHLIRAYAAVHNTEIKDNLSNSRDAISEMNLTQLTDADLYEVAEEVLEEVFTKNSDIADAKELIESVFKAASAGDASPVRTSKIERLGEAFVKAFDRITEKSIRVAVESYSDYRRGKEILARMNDNPNHDRSKERIHNALVAEDRRVVKNGLLSMIESVGSAVDKTLSAVGDIAKVGAKAAVGTAKGAAGAVKIAGKVAKGTAKAAGRIAGTPVGVAKAVKKGFQSGTQSESIGSAIDKTLSAAGDVAKVGAKAAVGTAKGAAGAVKVASKVAKGVGKAAGRVAGTPVGVAKSIKKGFKSGSDTNEAYTLTKADKSGNTVAWQNRDKKNPKTGEAIYKKADHLKKEELEATGLFSEHEIKKIFWNDFIEGYQRNPEKGEAEAKKADKRSARQKRMDDPEKGINSPAFQQFMRDRGLA